MADLQPRFIEPGALTIAGRMREFTPDTLSQIGELWFEMQSQISLITGAVGGDAYGVWYDVLKGGGRFSYIAGVRVGEFAPIPPSFSRAMLVPLHYAVFTHTGPRGELRRTVDAVLSQWLPKSGRELSTVEGQPDFIERYPAEFNRTGVGAIEIWLPLKKK